MNLSHEEIAKMLSGSDVNPGSSQEDRERLHSIENVSKVNSYKEKSSGNEKSLLMFNFTCTICNLSYQCLNDLKSHQVTHRMQSHSPSSYNPSSPEVKSVNQSPSCINSCKMNTDFLDTFKSHLLNNSTSLKSEKNVPLFDKSSEKNRQTVKNPFPTIRKLYRCAICNFCSSKVLKYKTHEILFHRDVNNLNCEYCDFQTTICVNLATHMQIHLLKCVHCPFQCLGSNEFNSHYERYHLMLKCNKCDYNSNSRRQFSQHLKQHLITQKFICDHCGLTFTLKPQLRDHLKKHMALSKKFTCVDCEKAFSRKRDLKSHMKSHKERFECNICKTKFSQKNILAHHLKVHSKNVYQCKECDSSFPKKQCLKIHRRVRHPTGLKCKHCDYTSTDTNDMSKHNCINKLYNVQKRSLNFIGEDSVSNNETKSSVTEGNSPVSPPSESKLKKNESGAKLSSNVVLSGSGCQIVNERNRSEAKSKIIENPHLSDSKAKPQTSKSVNRRTLHGKNPILRQKLPSRVNKNTNFTSNKNNFNEIKIRGRPRKVISKKPCVKNPIISTKRNGSCKTGGSHITCVPNNNQCKTNRKINRKIKLLSKQGYLLKDLDCMSTIFGKKSSLTNILIDPVMYVGGNYVECYYQSQPVVLIDQEHLENRFSHRPLLSCPLCLYKTNSTHLLQRHTAESHAWDRTVIKTLFS